MTTRIEAKGKIFTKSSFSGSGHSCVGVCFEGEAVHTINTNVPDGQMITYTKDEWEAFIAGVKKGEFDL